ncbi:MAG TPA: hypothetical protein VN711_01265 [Candidatus Saccharimonadales bacterium]|nr:hypothetical protein [Candidatus Saccharimonadales bacterium]
MKKTAQTTSTSTQKFTEILDIREDIVLLQGGNACIVLELQAVNFTLLSSEEQDAKVYAYAALLNSLSFPIQIIIRSKKVEISAYIASLADAAKQTANQKLSLDIARYKQFVENLVTTTTILDKQFYIVISYSSLEEGVSGAAQAAHLGSSTTDDFFIKAQAGLHTKADELISQIDRMNIRAKLLDHDGLVHVFHDIYNGQSNRAIALEEQQITAMKGGR